MYIPEYEKPHHDTEARKNSHRDLDSTGWDIAELKHEIEHEVGRDVYRDIPINEAGSLFGGVHRAIGMGFFMPTETLFGLGEREDSLVLKRTTS